MNVSLPSASVPECTRITYTCITYTLRYLQAGTDCLSSPRRARSPLNFCSNAYGGVEFHLSFLAVSSSTQTGEKQARAPCELATFLTLAISCRPAAP